MWARCRCGAQPAILIAGQDPGKIVEVKAVPITRDALEKNDIKTVQDLDKKLPGFGVSDLATAPWLTAPAEKTQ
ncbi:MAG TPA: hypothetical protein VGG77_07320 [Roseiarcus sp.]